MGHSRSRKHRCKRSRSESSSEHIRKKCRCRSRSRKKSRHRSHKSKHGSSRHTHKRQSRRKRTKRVKRKHRSREREKSKNRVRFKDPIEEKKSDRNRKTQSDSCKKPIFYKEFPRYRKIQKYLREVQLRYPNKAKVEDIGKTVNGHDILMIKLSNNIQSNRRRDIALIDATIHAREWISLTTSLYFIENAVKHSTLLNLMDIFVIPCLNPDGYEYTHLEDRLWSKNLSANCSCYQNDFGVNLNRNFPFCFGGTGSSSIKSASLYRGPNALSEPEARSLANIFDKYNGYIKLYVSLHANGNKILYPYGFTRTEPPDADEMMKCAILAQQAIYRKGNKRCYRVGNCCKLLHKINGSSIDFAKGTHGVIFSYMLELPKFGKSGYEPNVRHIPEIGKETYSGLTAMIKHVHKYYNQKRSDCKCKSIPVGIS